MKEKKKTIGFVGVDSGQVVICDPCYLDKEWDRSDEYKGDRTYDVVFKKKKHVVDMELMLRRGFLYTSPFDEFDGMSMNDLIKKKMAVKREVVQTGVFGYNGCCLATNSNNLGGQLNYRMGHAGAGVAVSSGYGDGYYPVVAHYNKDGRVSKVEILFDEE